MFTATKFLGDKFESVPYVISLVAAYGFLPPTREAVLKWIDRDSIPAQWFAVLLGVLELEHGVPVSVLPFLRRQ